MYDYMYIVCSKCIQWYRSLNRRFYWPGKSQRHKCCTNPHPTLLYYPLLRNPKYWPYFSLTISLTKLLSVISVGQIIYYLVKYHYGKFFLSTTSHTFYPCACHNGEAPFNLLASEQAPNLLEEHRKFDAKRMSRRLRTSRTGSVFADWQRPPTSSICFLLVC